MPRLLSLVSGAATAALVLLAGCKATGLAGAVQGMLPEVGASRSAAPASAAETVAAAAGPAARPTGRLDLVIRWPVGGGRDLAGYRAQLLPDSTDLLSVTVSSGSTPVATASVQRVAGEATASVSLTLATSNNLSVEVVADAAGTTEPIARGTASGVNILQSKRTPVSIQMTPLYVPTIQFLSSDVASPGDTVTVQGFDLAVPWAAAPEFLFSGSGASVSAQVTIDSSSSLTVTVPAGATVGPVQVIDDGVPSQSSSMFWVATGLSINSVKAPWDPSTGDDRILATGQPLAMLSATAQWVVATGTSYGPEPQPTWTTSQPLGSFSPPAGFTSVFTAGSQTGSTVCAARLGSLQSNSLTVNVRQVTLAISPATARIGPSGAIDATYSAVDTLTDTPSDTSTLSAAVFSVSTDSIAIDPSSGLATVANLASDGTFTVTASSPIDPTQVATAAITLGNYEISALSAEYGVFSGPVGVALDSSGNAWVSDTGDGVIKEIQHPLTGPTISTLPMTSVMGLAAGLGTTTHWAPMGIAMDAQGDGFVADALDNVIREISPQGVVSIYAGSSNGVSGFQNCASGGLPLFSGPQGVAVDSSGNLFVADTGNNVIREVTPAGAVSTVAGSGNAAESDGNGVNASFNSPVAVTLDASGDLFVADSMGNAIREISPTGAVSTVATGVWSASGVAVDGQGDVYATDGSNNAGAVYKIYPGGRVVQIAGGGLNNVPGIGTATHFAAPWAIAIDGSGNLFVADSQDNTIRLMVPVP